MHKYILLITITLIIVLTLSEITNVTSNPAFKQFEFKVIKGLRITTDGNHAYILEPLESGKAINVVKIEDGEAKFKFK